MNTSPMATTPLYRLRFVLEQEDLTVDLQAGEFSVGSSRQADIHLPVAGVSRRHALLTVSADALVIEDLESTNGTLVNGARVKRSSVEVGAELRFGPVHSHVDAVKREETELAIVLNQPPETVACTLPPEIDETTLVVADPSERTGQWLEWIAGFIERLRVKPASDPSAALAFLGECLEVQGCCIVQWPQGSDPVAMAAWASVFEIPALDEVRTLALSAEHADGTSASGVGFVQSDPPLSAAFVTRPDDEPIGLMIWGDFAARLHSSSFLRTLILLLDHHFREVPKRSPTPGEQLSERYPSLVFPRRYRPGTSPPMAALYTHMRPLLKGVMPVLINGETGVGKELVARILHRSSDRRQGPFVAVNCAAIPNDLLEAEMFGIGRGVATGVDARIGKFQQAEGGTLFLDEIGEMAPVLQAKLLRVLQEREIHPLGGRAQAIDVRIVSATNVDLAEHMRAGALRSDLFYRLAGFVLEVPPLRRCREDIPGLVEFFLRLFAEETQVQIRGITVAALRRLTSYPWPGNIRELEHEIRHLVYTSRDGEVIDSERISARLKRPQRTDTDPAERFVETLETLDLNAAVQAVEDQLIRTALRRAGGIKVEACRLLGLSRNGLDKKMKRLDIPLPDDEPTPH